MIMPLKRCFNDRTPTTAFEVCTAFRTETLSLGLKKVLLYIWEFSLNKMFSVTICPYPSSQKNFERLKNPNLEKTLGPSMQSSVIPKLAVDVSVVIYLSGELSAA